MLAQDKGWRARFNPARMLCSGIWLVLGLSVAAAPSAIAQDQFWEKSFPGFGKSKSETPQRTAHEGPERKVPGLNDLRADQIPLRSQQMIDALEAAIEHYQTIVTKGGWPTIPGSQPIRPEDSDERVGVLYRRLSISGEWRKRPTQSFFGIDYSAGLEDAVRRFQENHGLRVTGRVDRQTLQALNVPAIARLAQLRINLQRLRELVAMKSDDRYILVNAAAFQAEAVENGVVELRHRVIVGKTERQTPTVRATIRALNFFPYWRVPESVATLDLIPRLVNDPDYLQQEKIRVYTGSYNGPEVNATSIDWRTVDARRIRFKQDPGPQNALGFVRIDMPNSEGVYMHDTPMRHLFNQRWRAFSAGCIRVQDVFTLVEWIAKNEPAGASRAGPVRSWLRVRRST